MGQWLAAAALVRGSSGATRGPQARLYSRRGSARRIQMIAGFEYAAARSEGALRAATRTPERADAQLAKKVNQLTLTKSADWPLAKVR